MKKMLVSCLTVITILAAIGLLNGAEAHYTRKVTVIKVQGQKITVQDKQGHQWSFNGEGYTENQQMTVTMHNNHTDNIDDDRIVKEVK